MRELHKFRITYLRRRSKPQPKSVIELLGKPSVSTAANGERSRELDEVLRRFLEAQRARETQAEQAHHLASKFVRVDANSQERRAAAKTIAGAYDKARSLTQTELDLMVAEMIIRIPDYAERKRELQFSCEEYESFGIPGDYIQAAARWRRVVEFERSRSSVHGAHEGCWADVYDGDQEDRACEAEPDPKSALGLCVEHEVQIMKPAYGQRAPLNAHKPGGGPGLWSTESDPLGILVLRPFEANQPNVFLSSAEPLSATNGSMPVAASALLSTSRLSRTPAPNRSLTIGAQKGASRQLHRRDQELRRRQPRGNGCTGPFRSSRRVPLLHHTMCNRGGWVMARRSSLWRAIFSAACHRHCNERETA
jgi:hypothetical protein